MHARLLFIIALSAAFLAPAAHSAAQNTGAATSATANSAANVDADAAKAFLTSVYKHYGTGGIGVDSVGPAATRYFHSSLVALLRADQKAASPEVGAIDADPVCACQDWNGIWDLAIEVNIDTPDHDAARATAKLSFYLSDPKDNPKDSLRKLSIKLAAENGGWRIYDITDETDPTAPFALRKALQDDIASYSRPK
jgi:hypothetical protein